MVSIFVLNSVPGRNVSYPSITLILMRWLQIYKIKMLSHKTYPSLCTNKSYLFNDAVISDFGDFRVLRLGIIEKSFILTSLGFCDLILFSEFFDDLGNDASLLITSGSPVFRFSRNFSTLSFNGVNSDSWHSMSSRTSFNSCLRLMKF